jgi:hypothetical protein
MVYILPINFTVVGFQVIVAANMKMTGFWDVAPCSVVEIGRRFLRDDVGSTHL